MSSMTVMPPILARRIGPFIRGTSDAWRAWPVR
jgi:hypothetical protein